MAASIEAIDRSGLIKTRVQNVLRALLVKRAIPVTNVTDELIQLVREYDVSVRAGVTKDGFSFVFYFSDSTQIDFDDRRAKSILRMMCANLAVRVGRSDQDKNIIFGGEGWFFEESNPEMRWHVRMMNTMHEHWFELEFSKGAL